MKKLIQNVKWIMVLALFIGLLSGYLVTPRPCTGLDCGGFCRNMFDCNIGCKCVGADINNQGICRSQY